MTIELLHKFIDIYSTNPHKANNKRNMKVIVGYDYNLINAKTRIKLKLIKIMKNILITILATTLPITTINKISIMRLRSISEVRINIIDRDSGTPRKEPVLKTGNSTLETLDLNSIAINKIIGARIVEF